MSPAQRFHRGTLDSFPIFSIRLRKKKNNKVAGTLGYKAPNYFKKGYKVCCKSSVIFLLLFVNRWHRKIKLNMLQLCASGYLESSTEASWSFPVSTTHSPQREPWPVPMSSSAQSLLRGFPYAITQRLHSRHLGQFRCLQHSASIEKPWTLFSVLNAVSSPNTS